MGRPDNPTTHGEAPFPVATPARYLSGGLDLARCHECGALVATVDLAAHHDWHGDTVHLLDELATRIEAAVEVLAVGRTSDPRTRRAIETLRALPGDLRAG